MRLEQYDTAATPSAGFEPLPAGDYTGKIIDAEIVNISANNDYGRCLKLTWEIQDDDYNGRLLFDRINLWAEGSMNNLNKVIQIANSRFAAIREALGVGAVVETDELLQIPCMLSVFIKNDPQYGPSNKIKKYYSLNPANTVNSTPVQHAPAAGMQTKPATNAMQSKSTGGAKPLPWHTK